MKIEDLPTVGDVFDSSSWSAVLGDEHGCGAEIDLDMREVVTDRRLGPIHAEHILAVPHLWAESPEGYGSTDVVALVELRDGWATLSAWCDTTGWDCRSGGTWRWAPTRAQAIAQGLDQRERGQLGLAGGVS